MKLKLFIAFLALSAWSCGGDKLVKHFPSTKLSIDPVIEHKVDSVLNLMTIDEKIGQLNKLTGNGEITGPITFATEYQEAIKKGKWVACSMLLGLHTPTRYKKLPLRKVDWEYLLYLGLM